MRPSSSGKYCSTLEPLLATFADGASASRPVVPPHATSTAAAAPASPSFVDPTEHDVNGFFTAPILAKSLGSTADPFRAVGNVLLRAESRVRPAQLRSCIPPHRPR